MLGMVTPAYDNVGDVDMCFLDFNKASDIVNHRVLFNKHAFLWYLPKFLMDSEFPV